MAKDICAATGERIRKLRRARNWRQIDLAEQSGVHDLRRTCAKLCRKNGGDLEQIKFLLGHASIQTTERYLGSEQEIAVAVNDNLGL
jgi:integrase